MARNEQLIRQHKIVHVLEGSRLGKTLAELRNDLVDLLGLTDLSERTVRRDIEALQAAGFDIDTHPSARGHVWKLGSTLRQLPKLQITLTELIALSVARDLLVCLQGTPFWQGAESLWHKIRESLPEPIRRHYHKHRKRLLVRGSVPKSYEKKEGMLATLNRAALEHRVVRILYQRADQSEPQPREIEPYANVVYHGSIYLVAAPHNAADGSFRHYKLDRIQRTEALDQWFTPRADFDPEKHFEHSIGIYEGGQPQEFRIQIAPPLAAWAIESPFHPNQRIARQDHEGLLLVVPTAYEAEILPRVLALRENAVILAPESARLAVARAAQRLCQRYADVSGLVESDAAATR